MNGEVSEWPKEHDWKSCMSRKGHRGFESLSLHHTSPIRAYRLGRLRMAQPCFVLVLRSSIERSSMARPAFFKEISLITGWIKRRRIDKGTYYRYITNILLCHAYRKTKGLALRSLSVAGRSRVEILSVGMWRNLVAHSLWERGVASSSLAIPTIFPDEL